MVIRKIKIKIAKEKKNLNRKSTRKQKEKLNTRSGKN
jgi:hypothetical protein